MTGSTQLLAGKRALVVGVANERSIAWAISQALRAAGARMAFTYLNEALEKRVRPLAESLDAEIIVPCDATKDEEIDAAFQQVQETWGGLDILIHAVGYAKKENLEGRFVMTDREGFSMAMDISAYSLVALAQRAHPMLKESSGNILTLTYYGSEKVIPNYNVMGVAKAALEASVRYLATDLGADNIRVNAISAGPIKTLAASGIKHFREMLDACEARNPLHRNITQEQVAQAALFLTSDMASGMTGEVMYVDNGYNVTGM